MAKMKEKDIKILWGRSGNKCAKCKCDLTQDNEAVTASFALGEHAHIVGEKQESPRGNSPLTPEERQGYGNRIILCPNCHAEIDKNEADWPVERLYLLKSEHELWVSETLGQKTNDAELAKEIAIASLIDSAVELCDLENWKEWTSGTLAPTPEWPNKMPDRISEFAKRELSAIKYDDYEEFNRAVKTFATLLHRASEQFQEHCVINGDILKADKFYKSEGLNENYNEDVARYEAWIDECYDLMREATKAANWFADVVRDRINPRFFVETGKFCTTSGPCYDFKYHTELPEFTEEEKSQLPGSLYEC